MKWLSKIVAWFKRLGGSSQSHAKQKPSDLTIRERKEKERREQESAEKDRIRQQKRKTEEFEKAKERALTWRNRALMARQQNNEDLVKQALRYVWENQVAAYQLQGREPPPEPQDIPMDLGFGDEPGIDDQSGFDRPWRPFDPSRVPKKPIPSSGGGEVSIPLPEPDDEAQ